MFGCLDNFKCSGYVCCECGGRVVFDDVHCVDVCEVCGLVHDESVLVSVDGSRFV